MTKYETILAEALTLTVAEQEQLGRILLQSVQPEPLQPVPESLDKIKRRIAAVESGSATLVGREEFEALLEEKRAARSSL